jgi:CxxC motif-containing protein (DUF1111 family)
MTSNRSQFLLIDILFIVAVGAQCDRPPQVGEPLHGLTPEQLAQFERGRQVFERVFTPEEGLGPLFNADACAQCHEDPQVGGTGDEVEVHATVFGTTLRDALSALDPCGTEGSQVPGEDTAPCAGCDMLLDRGGPVYQIQVTDALRQALGIDSEPIPPEASIGRRTIPDLFGFGLLDAVPDSTLLALADPGDANGDGISGRVNHFLDGRIGRFGRKAFTPTLTEFNDGAFQIEQGVTTSAAPDEGTVGGQPIPPGVDPLPEPEIGDEDVNAASDFVRFLAPPPPKPMHYQERRGRKVFERIQCAACHVPELRTGPSDIAALANRDVHAYTDLLLHDMGPDLADICLGDATPSEFRTEPLMGLGLASFFLHDGRASSIEEAIRLHGGEATASRDAFLALSKRDRRALLAFLGGL